MGRAFTRSRLKVGGVAARLDLARESLLMAKVPAGAMTGMVTLEVNGMRATVSLLRSARVLPKTFTLWRTQQSMPRGIFM